MRWLWALVFLSLCCCSHVARLDAEKADKRLHFVHDGQTTRQEVIGRLGQPHATFESDRIVTYLLEGSHSGLIVAQEYEDIQFHLVLVFGPDQVLERHSLIRVWPPER